MRLIRAKNYEEMSRETANLIASYINIIPDCVLGLATGSTPLGTYKRLIQYNEDKLVDFSEVRTVNLDEYKGLPAESEQSYRYYMDNNLFHHVNIKKDNTYLPDGLAKDPEAECLAYDELIEDLGGIDLQLLGIGHNGHIGFNEPAEDFAFGTNEVDLTQSTIDANKRFFEKEEDVPKKAFTMGIGSIFQAESIVMVISGKDKAQILKDAFFGPITPQVPASILQLHNNFILIADEDALSLIDEA